MITYKLKFIDSFRFMLTSLSKLVYSLSDRLHKDKCKDCKSKPVYLSVKDFNKELIKTFPILCQFCNGDINKFVLLLRKGVYHYEYMDSWEKFNKK